MARTQLSDSDNLYFTSHFDEDLNLYELAWHAKSEDMEDEEYQSLMLRDRDQALEYPMIEYYLLDNREFLFSMSPDLQEWAATEITAKMMEGQPVKKIAVLMSSDFIAQLSVEQTMEENEGSELVTRYFDDEQEAREWILGIS